MALRVPSIIQVATGAVTAVTGSETGRGKFTAADLLGGKLLDALNLLRDDINATLVPLSTGETSPIYFEDLSVDSVGTKFRLTHGLKRRVRWQVVDWMPATTGQEPQLERDPDSTADVLVLRSYRAGTVTLRVW